MPRHYIGYSPSGRKAFFNVHKNERNQPLVLLEEGEQARIVLDFIDFLDSGETISSATVANESIAVTVATVSPKVTLTASGAGSFGQTVVTVTLSTGDKIVETIEIRNKVVSMPPLSSDYCAA